MRTALKSSSVFRSSREASYANDLAQLQRASFASYLSLGCDGTAAPVQPPCGGCSPEDDAKDYVGIFDIFKIGIGPSSSHTMGPMTAAADFVEMLRTANLLHSTASVEISLYGSLALTGKGHATDKAAVLGLVGFRPATTDPDAAEAAFAEILRTKSLSLGGEQRIAFNYDDGGVNFFREVELPFHPNAMTLIARRSVPSSDLTREDSVGSLNKQASDDGALCDEEILLAKTFYSIGGGFVVTEDELVAKAAGETISPSSASRLPATPSTAAESPMSKAGEDNNNNNQVESPFFPDSTKVGASLSPAQLLPFPFSTADDLIRLCNQHQKSIAEIVIANECQLRGLSKAEVHSRLDEIAACMANCVARGLRVTGHLPVSGVPRRAAAMKKRLEQAAADAADPLLVADWTALFARAVNEENACGGRVVTSPTNGAAGTVPAVLEYYRRFKSDGSLEGVRVFLATAAGIGMLCKRNASISGAEAGCQAEVGSACAMAAAGLAAVSGGTVLQIENAAEIALEHCLGLTCDPINGLVQIPCIERNAVAAIKAVTAARLALMGDGKHEVSLDSCIETMYRTGIDLHNKYRETSLGGLAQYARKSDW